MTTDGEKPRRCLICRKLFSSLSASNRICKPCKKSRKHLANMVDIIPLDSLAHPRAEQLLLCMETRRNCVVVCDDEGIPYDEHIDELDSVELDA